MLLKEKLALGLAEIGTFVNRDHSNIVHYIKGHDDMIRWEVDYRKKYNACKLIADEVIKNEVVERFDPDSQLQKALQYIEELKEENEKPKVELNTGAVLKKLAKEKNPQYSMKKNYNIRNNIKPWENK